jgi:hypothetical protein
MEIGDLIRSRYIGIKIETSLLWVLSLTAANSVPNGR